MNTDRGTGLHTVSPAVCTLCGGALTLQLAGLTDAGSGDSFDIHQCRECGLGCTVPQPPDIAPYYGDDYYGNRHGITDRYCTWRRQRFVKAVTASAPPGRLLDIGCGDGSFLRAMAAQGWDCTGVEVGAIPEGDQGGIRVVGTLAQAAEGGPYDCVTAWHSLEHFADLREPAALLPELVRPGGSVVVAVPDAEGRQALRFGPRWLHRDVPRHLFHFGERSLRRFFRLAGLEVQRSWHTEYEYDLAGYVQGILDGWFRERQVFFRLLTGRPVGTGVAGRLLHLGLGGLLLAVCAPLPLLDAAGRRGGTLVLAGRRPS